MYKLKKNFFLSVSISLTFIIIQTITHKMPDLKLHGVEIKNKRPRVTFNEFCSGKWQVDMEKWLAGRVGFRGIMIRLDNQFNYSFFNEISSKYICKIILGKNKSLFEKHYIDDHNRLNLIPVGKLEEKVKKMKELQQLLLQKGVKFLFIITPSKTYTYPELINDSYILEHNLTKKSNYENILPLLKKYKINYLDGQEFVLKLKKRGTYPVFPLSGTHWNYYSAFKFTKTLISELEKDIGKSLVSIKLKKMKKTSDPFGSDSDLATLTNVLFPRLFYSDAYYYPETVVENFEGEFRPNVLFVGGSFLWTILHYTDMHYLYKTRDAYYYFSKEFKFPGNKVKEIDKKTLKLKNVLRKYDVVVVEANVQTIDNIGFGFVESAVTSLRDDLRQY